MMCPRDVVFSYDECCVLMWCHRSRDDVRYSCSSHDVSHNGFALSQPASNGQTHPSDRQADNVSERETKTPARVSQSVSLDRSS